MDWRGSQSGMGVRPAGFSVWFQAIFCALLGARIVTNESTSCSNLGWGYEKSTLFCYIASLHCKYMGSVFSERTEILRTFVESSIFCSKRLHV